MFIAHDLYSIGISVPPFTPMPVLWCRLVAQRREYLKQLPMRTAACVVIQACARRMLVYRSHNKYKVGDHVPSSHM